MGCHLLHHELFWLQPSLSLFAFLFLMVTMTNQFIRLNLQNEVFYGRKFFNDGCCKIFLKTQPTMGFNVHVERLRRERRSCPKAQQLFLSPPQLYLTMMRNEVHLYLYKMSLKTLYMCPDGIGSRGPCIYVCIILLSSYLVQMCYCVSLTG